MPNSPIGRADADSIEKGAVEVGWVGSSSVDLGASFSAAYILATCCVTCIINSVSDARDWYRTFAWWLRWSNERYHGVS